jgi:hypothetical protein
MPNPHGGARKGAGRKPSPFKLQILKIACTDEEYKVIIKTIKDTRKRAELLLKECNQ